MAALAGPPGSQEGDPDPLSTPPFDSRRFQLVRRLGSGGFGVVYLARDGLTGSEVALKTLPVAHPELIYRLKREFRALADLRHENLVSFYELFVEENRIFITMEYVPGANFLGHVRAPGLDLTRLRHALKQLTSGLSALHSAGKLHRDVKPSNVLVTPEERVVLLDFGLVTDVVESELGRSMELAGTPEYMSPEHALNESLSPATDWYSVGVMLYQALTGDVPFRGSWEELAAQREGSASLPNRLTSAPRDLAELCSGLLTRDPRQRAGAREVLAVLGDVRAETDARAEAQAQPTFLGREAELDQLDAALARVKAGESVTLLLDGISGSGKTSLVERFLVRAERHCNALALRGRCYERERVPYSGLDSLTDELAHFLKSLDPLGIARLIPRNASALDQLFPVFDRIPAFAERRTRVPEGEVTRQEVRRQAFGALRELLARVADARVLILHVDDLQWGDLDTAALLSEIARPPDAPAMLLILSFRSEERHRSPCIRAVVEGPLASSPELNLGPLSEKTAEELMHRLLPEQAQADAGRLARETDGLPFLIQEVARFVGESGMTPDADDLHALEGVLRARVERLPAAARSLLEMLALAGHPVPELVAWRATGLAGSPWDGSSLLRSHHLIRSTVVGSERHLEPSHDRIRHAVVAGLAPERRNACHRGLAEAMEASGEADPEVLAWHHEAAGNTSMALRFVLGAAAQAQEVLAFERAVRLYRWALRLAPQDGSGHSDLVVQYGEALISAGRSIEAARALLGSAGVASLAMAVQLRRRAAEQFMFAGRIDEAKALIRDTLRAAGFPIAETYRQALLSVVLRRMYLRLRGFRARRKAKASSDRIELLEHVYNVAVGISFVDAVTGADLATRYTIGALNSGDALLIGKAIALSAVFAVTEAPNSRAGLRLLRLVEERAASIGDRYLDWAILAFATFRGYFSGDWREAVRNADEATKILRKEMPTLVWEEWTCRYLVTWSLFFLGEWNEMERLVLAGFEEARDRGNVYGMAGMCSPFGVAMWLRRGELTVARQKLSEVTRNWSVEGVQFQHYWFLSANCLCHLYAGEGAEAWALVQSRWRDIATSLTFRFPIIRMNVLYMRGCAALGAMAQARGSARAHLLAEAARTARQLASVELPPARPLADLLRAGVAARSGKTDEAIRAAEDALAGLARHQMHAHAAAVNRHLAHLRGRVPPEFLPGQRIVDPDAIAQMLVPQLTSNSVR